MCRREFEDGLIHIDHDHGCCQERNRSCGKCVRGLLCHRCNIALGYVEAYRELADAYLVAAQAARRPAPVESPWS
jgi:recombination endonuclease VII